MQRTQYAPPSSPQSIGSEQVNPEFTYNTADEYILNVLTSNFRNIEIAPKEELRRIAMENARSLSAMLLRRRWLVHQRGAIVHEVQIASAIYELGLKYVGEHPLTIARK